jgi:hypothetical protein
LVVDSVQGFGKDGGEEMERNKEGYSGPFQAGDKFARDDGGGCGTKEELWLCGDGSF